MTDNSVGYVETKVESAVTGVVKTAESVAEKIWSEIETGITVLKDEGQKVVNFIDTTVPAAEPIVSDLVTAGEKGAQALVRFAEAGLKDKADNLAADAVSLTANFLQGTGLVTVGQSPSAAAVALAKSAVNSAIDAAFVKALAALA